MHGTLHSLDEFLLDIESWSMSNSSFFILFSSRRSCEIRSTSHIPISLVLSSSLPWYLLRSISAFSSVFLLSSICIESISCVRTLTLSMLRKLLHLISTSVSNLILKVVRWLFVSKNRYCARNYFVVMARLRTRFFKLGFSIFICNFLRSTATRF